MAADLSHLLSVDKIKHKYETGDINSEPKEKFVIIKHQNKYLRDYALPQGSFLRRLCIEFKETTHPGNISLNLFIEFPLKVVVIFLM